MNTLIVGSDTAPILRHIPNDNFLLIDDGPLIDEVAKSARTTRAFDVAEDSFDPLKDMDYLRARDFLDVLNAVFPEGANTLTRRNSNFHMLEALMEKPNRLERLIRRTKETEDAWQKIQMLLLSPVLHRVLNQPTNFSLKGTVLARLDRARLGDFDAFVIGNLLISQYPGTVVLPDFGFYACGFHSKLIRQDRLVAGIASFDEVPVFRSRLLSIATKEASQCTPEDAKLLAIYAGIIPNTNEYHDFVERSIRPA